MAGLGQGHVPVALQRPYRRALASEEDGSMTGTPQSGRPHILVVDDEATVRESLAFALRRDYAIHTAARGGDACRLLQAQPIAAILLDALLDGEHGLDLVPRFRALSPAPILLLTGHSSEELAIRAVRAHVADYLKKPPRLSDLLATLARLVGPPRTGPDPVAHARELLATPAASALTVTDLATAVGLSPRQLRRRVGAATGAAPRDHLLQARIREALRLLRETDQPVADIARALGYQSPRRFARRFRRLLGQPPSAFRP